YRPHGHNYVVEVTVEGALDPLTGFSADLEALDAVVRRVLLDRVDHYDLSSAVPELDGVITTGENLARTFWDWLAPALPAGSLHPGALGGARNNTLPELGA